MILFLYENAGCMTHSGIILEQIQRTLTWMDLKRADFNVRSNKVQ